MTHQKNKPLFQDDAASKTTQPILENQDGKLFASQNNTNDTPLFSPDKVTNNVLDSHNFFSDDNGSVDNVDEPPLFIDDNFSTKDNADKPSPEKCNLQTSANVKVPPQLITNNALLTIDVLSQDTWKMLVVDDEEDIHQITHLLLNDFVFQGKPLTLFSANSAEKAKILLQEHPDIAVILLDVVMETHDAGLFMVRYIRETLKNRFIRIILRTGQPGYAPEEEVILKYEINDYANKTELTRQKLMTITTASLRAYTDLMTIESYRQHLEEKVAERTFELQMKNEELTVLNHALIKLNQEKNEFLGIAAHDLKNPLAAIQGLADLIPLSFNDDSAVEKSIKEITEYAQMIAISSQQMYELITNILDFNAIENSKLKISLRKRDLRDSVQSVVKNYLQRAQAKNINLQFQSLEQECLIWTDDIAIRQILENLISNAIKYSPSSKTVIVRLTKKGNQVLCEVQDEGPGLDEEDKAKLFGKFSRLTPQPTAGEHSTGLGLFIVKKFVEAMNGKVWCQSKLEQGTTFFLELPCVIDNE